VDTAVDTGVDDPVDTQVDTVRNELGLPERPVVPDMDMPIDTVH